MILRSAVSFRLKRSAVLVAALLLANSSSTYAAPESCYAASKLGHYRLMTYIGDRNCLTFNAPRAITGIWIDRFEGSKFYENANRLRQIDAGDDRIWLSIDNETLMTAEFKRRVLGRVSSRAYRIKFIGRYTSNMRHKPYEGYGHLGGSSGLVLVDRVIDWEDIGPADLRRRERQ